MPLYCVNVTIEVCGYHFVDAATEDEAVASAHELGAQWMPRDDSTSRIASVDSVTVESET